MPFIIFTNLSLHILSAVNRGPSDLNHDSFRYNKCSITNFVSQIIHYVITESANTGLFKMTRTLKKTTNSDFTPPKKLGGGLS